MTFSDNIPWMLTFVLCYFLTTLCVKTSLPAPIFTNSLSHGVGKRWQHLNSRNKGWAVQELPISQGHVQQITQKIRGVSKACWGKRGLSSLCSACSCPEQASSRCWRGILKSWLSTAWFRAAERHLCSLWIQPSSIPWKCYSSFLAFHCVQPGDIFLVSPFWFTGLPPKCRSRDFGYEGEIRERTFLHPGMWGWKDIYFYLGQD